MLSKDEVLETVFFLVSNASPHAVIAALQTAFLEVHDRSLFVVDVRSDYETFLQSELDGKRLSHIGDEKTN